MRASVTLIGVPTICACLTLMTQEPPLAQLSAAQLIRQWDKNDDGQLTVDEVQREQLFKRLDTNGDGVVTQEELSALGRDWKGRGGAQQAWRGVGVSESAPLPPADQFQPRPHGDEATAAGLNPDVLAKIDVEMQRHVAAKNVAGLIALIHGNGQRGYCETFGHTPPKLARAVNCR